MSNTTKPSFKGLTRAIVALLKKRPALDTTQIRDALLPQFPGLDTSKVSAGCHQLRSTNQVKRAEKNGRDAYSLTQ